MTSKRATNTQLRRRRGERGNALMEFALMSTVLMGTTLGVVDFGRIFSIGTRAVAAASAGTSYAALDAEHYSNMTNIQQAALRNLQNVPGAEAQASLFCKCTVGGDNVNCETEDVCGEAIPRITYVQVAVTVPFRTLSGLPMIPGLTQVNAKSIVRVE